MWQSGISEQPGDAVYGAAKGKHVQVEHASPQEKDSHDFSKESHNKRAESAQVAKTPSDGNEDPEEVKRQRRQARCGIVGRPGNAVYGAANGKHVQVHEQAAPQEKESHEISKELHKKVESSHVAKMPSDEEFRRQQRQARDLRFAECQAMQAARERQKLLMR